MPVFYILSENRQKSEFSTQEDTCDEGVHNNSRFVCADIFISGFRCTAMLVYIHIRSLLTLGHQVCRLRSKTRHSELSKAVFLLSLHTTSYQRIGQNKSPAHRKKDAMKACMKILALRVLQY